MALWEDFEIDCTNYLNKKFGRYAEFVHCGGSDSTSPDILVKTAENSFYIDAKHSPAQCGQFVLFPDTKTRTFVYSKKNAAAKNKWLEKIIEYMNDNFAEFAAAGSTCRDVAVDDGQKIFSSWISDFYKEKNVKFFITNNFILVPAEKISDYFEIKAKYRVKRSGSSSFGKNRVCCFSDFLGNNSLHDYKITGVHADGNKLFVSSERNLHRLSFSDGKNEYMFSLRNGEYEVRKLSATYNANVIFSIELRSSKGITDEEFINYIKN